MNTKPASYTHSFGNDIVLQAFAIDPTIKQKDLEILVCSKEETAHIDQDSTQNTIFVSYLNNLSDLEVKIDLEKEYRVPVQLQAYREAVQKASDAKGRYNGPVAIVDGPVRVPLSLFRGGYYDFIATKLKAVPAELVPEQYPPGKNIEELFSGWGISTEERARYLGFAYVVFAHDGKEVCLVQRAKGMAIAPDCISVPGSTPNPQFEPGFDFQQYCQEHVRAEMKEEFNLENSEFCTKGIYLFEDKKEVPFGAIEIHTPLPVQELATRIHGQKQAIKEHPVIYAISPEGINLLLEKLPVFPSNVQLFKSLHK